MGGRPIDTRVRLKDGTTFADIAGLREYLLHSAATSSYAISVASSWVMPWADPSCFRTRNCWTMSSIILIRTAIVFKTQS